MTVGVLEARTLGECLDKGDADLPRRYYRKAVSLTYLPWWFVVCGDYLLP
ncbi:hypothetical protein Slala05_81510 [Streptomyces lavendulae subsp. lavendulae]|nr:hypothetical protein Slala05_81510 [Streptomyces lavendulae subsp. lavendulae]